jgi:hypothetical protein
MSNKMLFSGLAGFALIITSTASSQAVPIPNPSAAGVIGAEIKFGSTLGGNTSISIRQPISVGNGTKPTATGTANVGLNLSPSGGSSTASANASNNGTRGISTAGTMTGINTQPGFKKETSGYATGNYSTFGANF